MLADLGNPHISAKAFLKITGGQNPLKTMAFEENTFGRGYLEDFYGEVISVGQNRKYVVADFL